MKFITLETQDEADFFFTTFVQKSALFDEYTHLGAVAAILKSTKFWNWVETGKTVKIALKWGAGQPDNWGNIGEQCLSVRKVSGTYELHDSKCYEINYLKFLCESVAFV